MNKLESKFTIGYEYEAHPPYYYEDIENKVKSNLGSYKHIKTSWDDKPGHQNNRIGDIIKIELGKIFTKTWEINKILLDNNKNLKHTSITTEGCGDIAGIEYQNGIFNSMKFSLEYADFLTKHIIKTGTAYHTGAGIHVHISKFKSKIKEEAIFSFFMNPKYYPYFFMISDRQDTLWMMTVKESLYFSKTKNEEIKYLGTLPQTKGYILVYRNSFHTYEFRLFAAKPENLKIAIEMLVSVRNTIDEKNDIITWLDWITYLESHKDEYQNIINRLKEYDLYKPFSELKPYKIGDKIVRNTTADNPNNT